MLYCDYKMGSVGIYILAKKQEYIENFSIKTDRFPLFTYTRHLFLALLGVRDPVRTDWRITDFEGQ